MISIIVPIYNVEKYVIGCLTSIQKQTYTDFEVICVDDGSTDSSAILTDNFIKTDSRFRVIHQDNQGLSCARNTGLDNVKGDLILFVDSDDYLHPQAVELLVSAQKKTNTDVVCCPLFKTSTLYTNCQFSTLNAEQMEPTIFDSPLTALMKNKLLTCANARLYRRSVINRFRFIKGIYYEDVPFATTVMATVKSVALVPYPLYYYYQNPTSILHSSFTQRNIISYETVIRSVYDYISTHRPQDLSAIRKTLLNGRFKMMVNQAIRRQKDLSVQRQLFIQIQQVVSALYAEGKISFEGLKLKHRACLWFLLKGKPEIARHALKWLF